MIKVNLLNSVTDRLNAGGVASVEKRVANPKTQTYLVLAAVAAMMSLVMGFDYVSANSGRASAEVELAEQQRIAKQMEAVIKEQNELDKQTKAINARIAAIQSLRATQKGPVAVLSEINARIPPINNFRLESIEQKGGSLVINGDSPNEDAVTQFGRSLEFSSGLFTNVSIEFERKALEGAAGSSGDPNASPAPKSETVNFKIKCAYTPPAASVPGASQAAAATAIVPVTPGAVKPAPAAK